MNSLNRISQFHEAQWERTALSPFAVCRNRTSDRLLDWARKHELRQWETNQNSCVWDKIYSRKAGKRSGCVITGRYSTGYFGSTGWGDERKFIGTSKKVPPWIWALQNKAKRDWSYSHIKYSRNKELTGEHQNKNTANIQLNEDDDNKTHSTNDIFRKLLFKDKNQLNNQLLNDSTEEKSEKARNRRELRSVGKDKINKVDAKVQSKNEVLKDSGSSGLKQDKMEESLNVHSYDYKDPKTFQPDLESVLEPVSNSSDNQTYGRKFPGKWLWWLWRWRKRSRFGASCWR